MFIIALPAAKLQFLGRPSVYMSFSRIPPLIRHLDNHLDLDASAVGAFAFL